MNREKFNEFRHHVILVSELARETGEDADFEKFEHAIRHCEPIRTRLELYCQVKAYRAFRKASAHPLAALLADRAAKVRRIKGE